MNPVHAAGSQVHSHNITTHLCEVDGDIAHCESYVLVCLLNHDGVTARVISGRTSTVWNEVMASGGSLFADRR